MNERLVLQIDVRNKEGLANLERLDTQMNELRRGTLAYRDSMSRLNKQIADNNAAMLTATKRDKDQLTAQNKRLRALQGLKRAEQELASTQLARLQLQRRELMNLEKLERAAERANQKRSRFGGGGSFGDTVMGAMGVVYSAQELGRLADTAFRLGDRLEGVHRGLEQVYGSSERAAERFAELNELAKLPGLDPEPLAKFDAIFKNLGATAEQNNILFTGVAKAITTFGGDVFGVNSALLQLSQGFSKNKIDMQDWKSINEQTGGTVIKVAEEVLGFTGGIEGMREAFKSSGQTLQDFLMPVFSELNNRFEGAPVDSYTNRIDNLNVAFQNYIGTVTRGNTAVSGFLEMLTGFFEGEAEAWRGSRSAGEAIKATGDAAKVSAAEIAVLQKDLGRVNNTLDTATEKFNTFKEQGINENTASMQQLSRRIAFLEERKAALSGQLDTAKTAMQAMLSPTEEISTEFRVLKQETEQVDTRFLSFRERGVALKDAIAELPPELTKINDLLPMTAVHAEKLDTYFENLKVSVVDLKEEQRALNLIYTEGQQTLNDYAPALNLTAHNADLMWQGWKNVGAATQSVDDIFKDLRPSLEDVYDSLNSRVNVALGDTYLKLGDIKTANIDPFDDLKTAGNEFYDQLDQHINPELDAMLDHLGEMADQEQIWKDVLGSMGRELSTFGGQIGEISSNIMELFTAPEQFAGKTLANVLHGIFREPFQGDYSRGAEGFYDPLPGGQAKLAPQPSLEDRKYQDILNIVKGQSHYGDGGIDFLRQHAQGTLVGYRPRLEQDVPDLMALLFPEGGGTASRRYNLHQSLTGRPQATPQAEADRIAYESGMMSPEEAEAYLAGYPETPTSTPTTPATGSDPSQASVDTEKIGDVHRFSGAESGQLKTLEGTLKEKRTDFIGLSDVDFSEILDGYAAYTTAIQAIYDAKMGFIQSVSNIDGQAKSTAMQLALQEYHALTFRANRDLEAVMSNNNLQLVNEFGATTGAFARNQVIKRLVVPDGPRRTSRSDSGPKMVTSTFVATGRERAETHRFTSAQSGELKNIEGRARQAATDFRNLQTKDFAEILTAYGTYTGLLQDLYDKRVEFIKGAHLTPAAQETALEAALIAFQDDTYTANQMLARVMGTADLRLVNEFDSTTGIIPRNQVIKGVVHGPDRGVIKAGPGPKTVTATSPSVTPSAALEYNALQRAERDLSRSPDAQTFEINRGLARTAADAYYQRNQRVIEQSGLTGAALQDKLEDNEFKWEAHLQKIDTATNKYAEAAKQKLETQQQEDKQRKEESMRTYERLLKDQERVEERRLSDIQKLREKGTENEANRLRKIEQLNADHQEKLFDIEKGGIRQREDLQKTFDEKVADIRRETFQKGVELLERYRSGAISEQDYRAGNERLQGTSADRIMEAGRTHHRGLGHQAIDESRAVEDAEVAHQRSAADIHQNAAQAATAIREQLMGLFTTDTPLTLGLQSLQSAENPLTLGLQQLQSAENPLTVQMEKLQSADNPLTLGIESLQSADNPLVMALTTTESPLIQSMETLTQSFQQSSHLALIERMDLLVVRLESVISNLSHELSGFIQSAHTPQSQPIELKAVLQVDSEQIVTPRLANAVTDQQNTNTQLGIQTR